jgi:general secretion pathway protein G
MRRPKFPRSQRSAGYTLFEIMLVLGIIAVLVGSAIYLLVGNIDVARESRVEADIQSISTQLRVYEMQNLRPPTTAQGLKALVTRPGGDPPPRRWKQLLERVPLDPWGEEYVYHWPGKKNTKGFDLFSKGPDRTEGGGDDIGNDPGE